VSTATREGSKRAFGIWLEWQPGHRWSNEGVTRLVGFLVEGIAARRDFIARLVIPDDFRDEVEEDFASLKAVEGQHFTLHSPRDVGMATDGFEDLAKFANANVHVDGWLTPFPSFQYAKLLNAPLTVVFPDAIPKVFPVFGANAWGSDGAHKAWEEVVREMLDAADRVITFSNHVAKGHAGRLFNVPSSKIAVIPHAPPDLSALLPFVGRNQATLGHAADLLREHCADRGWLYLRDFPFEQVPFIAVSTQDRVTKNIQLAARALQVLLCEQRHDLKVVMTAPLHFGSEWTALPSVIEEAMTHMDIVSVPDLPRNVHAALLHCAAVTVHPSIFEGGHAPFPFYESVSVGTPCLMAWGPHVQELAEEEPSIIEFTFDPNDTDGLAELIKDAIARRDEILEQQQAIFGRLKGTDWAHVGNAYAAVATSHAGGVS
jgi:glycosyltransferase involved in cell wall biosynthesis